MHVHVRARVQPCEWTKTACTAKDGDNTTRAATLGARQSHLQKGSEGHRFSRVGLENIPARVTKTCCSEARRAEQRGRLVATMMTANRVAKATMHLFPRRLVQKSLQVAAISVLNPPSRRVCAAGAGVFQQDQQPG